MARNSTDAPCVSTPPNLANPVVVAVVAEATTVVAEAVETVVVVVETAGVVVAAIAVVAVAEETAMTMAATNL